MGGGGGGAFGAGFGGFATTKKGKHGFFRRPIRRPINVYTYGYPYYGYGYPYYPWIYPATVPQSEPTSPLERMLDAIENARTQIEIAMAAAMSDAVRRQLQSTYNQLGNIRNALLAAQSLPTVGGQYYPGMAPYAPHPQVVNGCSTTGNANAFGSNAPT